MQTKLNQSENLIGSKEKLIEENNKKVFEITQSRDMISSRLADAEAKLAMVQKEADCAKTQLTQKENLIESLKNKIDAKDKEVSQMAADLEKLTNTAKREMELLEGKVKLNDGIYENS